MTAVFVAFLVGWLCPAPISGVVVVHLVLTPPRPPVLIPDKLRRRTAEAGDARDLERFHLAEGAIAPIAACFSSAYIFFVHVRPIQVALASNLVALRGLSLSDALLQIEVFKRFVNCKLHMNAVVTVVIFCYRINSCFPPTHNLNPPLRYRVRTTEKDAGKKT